MKNGTLPYPKELRKQPKSKLTSSKGLHFPEWKHGTLEIIHSRLKAGTLKVNFQTAEVYSLHAGRKKWIKLTLEYDAKQDRQRYAFVVIRKCCIHYRKDSLGRTRKIITWRRKKIAVHKLIWIAAYGRNSIPQDHQLHHKNEDSLINGLFNLELLHKFAHTARHNGTENHEPWL